MRSMVKYVCEIMDWKKLKIHSCRIYETIGMSQNAYSELILQNTFAKEHICYTIQIEQHSTKESKPWKHDLRFFRYWPSGKRNYESPFIISHVATHFHVATAMTSINHRAPAMWQVLPNVLSSFHHEYRQGL